MKVGEFIKEYRIKKGMTQEELAKKIGKTRTMLTHYETGRANVSDRILQEIGKILDIPKKEIDNYTFPFNDDFTEETKIEMIVDDLEKMGYLVLFDKNKNVYIHRENKLILKTSERNFLGFYDYGFFYSDSDNNFSFKDVKFIALLKDYDIHISKNKTGKWVYTDSFHGEFVIDEELLFSLLFSFLDTVNNELNDFVKFMTEEKPKI